MTAPFAIPNHPGNYRLPCPQCQKGPRDTALSCTVKPDGKTVYLCFRCGLSGADGQIRPGEIQQRPPRKRDTTDKTERARRLIERARPAKDTLAERYLKSRGLTLPNGNPLLFTSEAFHWPTGLELPCMIAPIIDIHDNQAQAAHCTFLKSDGTGKAGVCTPRLYLGPKSGGCVKLTPDEDVTLGLALAEGIETALVGVAARYPTWACLDAGNMAAFPVLDGITSLTVLADNDDAGMKAAGEVAKRWKAAGKRVRVIEPPEPGQDWNDVIQGDQNG